MANNFKSGQAASVGTSYSTVYTVPTGKKSILIELDIANTIDATISVNVGIANNGATTPTWFIMKGGVIPQNDTLQVVSGQKIVLDASTQGKAILVNSSVNTSCDVIVSVLEDVQ